MSERIPVAILGASGRMGATLLRCLPEFPALALAGASTAAETGLAGRDAGEAVGLASMDVVLHDDPAGALAGGARVAVDFTLPAAVAANAAACRAAGVGLVCGVTGLDARAEAALREAAEAVPVLWAPNMSAGVAVLERLAALAAAALADFDAGVYEVHHTAKRDAPSGTALALGRAVVEGRGQPPAAAAPDERLRAGGLAYAAERLGDVVGEHTVTLAGPGERLELTHRATDRAIFARGALRAAAWLAGREPGMYTLGDVLGLGRVDTLAGGQ
ncbi:4-hydroxy-tetrahydrodipicolinate reductase [Thioalkalivibrio sp. XN279]|uniref:4-hydroxy-tetrahydrodipicolinate reductase n=1 Tax=Thioalkalivibrio sp. XN279 TaxID=2714953 RepID=UPI00140C8D6A|nr:4-hydroxy-tetrahydrodipicolinate reductase [Thioalkalivibrio sp. XN279]NHA14578.1 4-hydroxy-tetrahydrodipicolinate reductase [Thioalkalivibrio sp. XN279]